MKNKKGFTLIELLAVIVILAIIALITVPTVLNIIDKAKKGAAEDSAYGVEKAADFYYLGNVGSSSFEETAFVCNGTACTSNLDSNVKLDIGGTVPTSGTIIVRRNGNVETSNLVINGYTCTKTNEKYNCGTGGSTPEEPVTPEVPSYTIGQAINFNPVDNTTCTNPVSTTGTKTGCMRWYVIENSNSESDSVKVILDHNTTGTVRWITETDYLEAEGTQTDWDNGKYNTKGPITLNKQLTTDTTGWHSSLGAHVPSAQEIATAVGTTFNQSSFYFETKTTTKPNPYSGTYGWLYDRTGNCASFGCTTADSSNNGYWTSTAHSYNSYFAWRVRYFGYLDYDSACNYFIGLRPVITISKSQL